MTGSRPVREWKDLPEGEQLTLREAYGYYLDTLPPTCSMDAKLARFQAWLAEQGIKFSPDQ